MTIHPKFSLGERVYFASNTEFAGTVTGICIRPEHITYFVVWSEDRDESGHYAIELTNEKNYSI